MCFTVSLMTTTVKRYYVEFGAAMVAYLVAVLISVPSVEAMPSSVWRYPLAALPILPSVGALIAFVRYLRTLDELQRRIQFEAFGIVCAVTVLATLSYGFLENAGLPQAGVIWIGPMMIVLWGLVSGLVSHRYSD